MAREAFTFGPFRLDLRAHRLLRGGEPVPLSAHLVDLLAEFASHPGELLTKQALFDAVWPDVFVTDNTLARAVADLRQALRDDPRQPRYLQTVARRGYRFVAEVKAEGARGEAAPADERERFDHLRQFVASVTDLEQLRVDGLDEVIARLEQAAAALPDYAPVHVALATAWTLTFEATRMRTRPDRDAVASAVAAASRACELDPGLAEAWATLAFALTSAGRAEDARAAARQAVRLEPDGWRHHFRLALAAWGEERLRAAERTLALMPGFPFACLLASTVLVARGLLAPAQAMAERGLASLGERTPDARLPACGLHWLSGAIASTEPATHDVALDAFAREIAAHDPGRLYSTEFVLNARHWRAGLLVRRGGTVEAVADLRAALALAPGHPRSLAALASLLERDGAVADARLVSQRSDEAIAALSEAGRHGEAALCLATRHAVRGDDPAALDAIGRLFDHPPADHTGWTLPVEPWLQHLRGSAPFEALLRRLAQRAV